ncbi:hypothetical protein [Streptomyces antibioticus]|uniref:Uncharacterized protein n=1 Tax=Streptomyces antibioticus TaxID=1890 RepID=A0AAE6YCA1_STRAT|nr:hypothetical protein [Streptomyces antibioticus]MCX5171695.1 hypothetical protein [Streptomyces antibioticus]OOQ48680.1 hypothetical protein AFM16_27080 [Streptomyces antibioticus]QIT46812.1 hypothetical protein HCX60_27555 [Streptomyces antibioticus]
MPFAPDQMRCDLMCGLGEDGRWWGEFSVFVDARALAALGLLDGQPTAAAASPPGWWHAAGERYAASRWPLVRVG